MPSTRVPSPRKRAVDLPLSRPRRDLFRYASLRDALSQCVLSRCALGCLCVAALGLGAGAHAQLQMYRASLHAHTAFSDGGTLYPDPSVNTPQDAATAAKAAGLTCFSTEDHGEYLGQDKVDLTISQMTKVSSPSTWSWSTTPTGFVGLWGFEWSGADVGAVAGTTAAGTGHIGVYGASGATGAADKGGGYTTETVTPAIYWHSYAPPGATTSQSIYQWILDHPRSPLGGTIVAQFNHPCLYPGATPANPAVAFNTEWWRKFEFVPDLDPYFTLMEMSSHGINWDTGAVSYFNGTYNEPYYQLALDQGWHLSPTNSEDNHADHYGAQRTADGILADTGIWALTLAANTPQRAQASVLAALRSRRTFAAEDRASTHAGMISIKFMVNTPRGYRWMGAEDLIPSDLGNNQCYLEITRPAGLTPVLGGKIQVITNRGVVALDLPTSGPGVKVSGNTATWNFSLPGDPPAAQLRASGTTMPAGIIFQYNAKPLPDPYGGLPMKVAFDASTSGRIQRYYYIRVQQNDGTTASNASLSYSAPIWIQRDGGLRDYDDGYNEVCSANVVSFTYDFGDGSPLEVHSATTSIPKFDGRAYHTYPVPGTYYPRVTVTYADGTKDVSVTRIYAGSATPPAPNITYGDVNGDGQINREDVEMLAQMAAGLLPASQAAIARADVFPPANTDPVKPAPGDGKINIQDSLRLARFLFGTGTSTPNATWP